MKTYRITGLTKKSTSKLVVDNFCKALPLCVEVKKQDTDNVIIAFKKEFTIADVLGAVFSDLGSEWTKVMRGKYHKVRPSKSGSRLENVEYYKIDLKESDDENSAVGVFCRSLSKNGTGTVISKEKNSVVIELEDDQGIRNVVNQAKFTAAYIYGVTLKIGYKRLIPTKLDLRDNQFVIKDNKGEKAYNVPEKCYLCPFSKVITVGTGKVLRQCTHPEYKGVWASTNGKTASCPIKAGDVVLIRE